ncbi:hypothetical protein [Lacticaseibacillus porcinae]|uniref:hypothetical protein n=1 Tax=Lacticaseibacillus porcinae TaxID=1123687 RepID=UPI000F77E770|nr:hypothetical protein [Lacticaseibacillus porcinae]
MINKNDSEAELKAFWPDFEDYLKLPVAEQDAITLNHLNEQRALIGGPPLDHIPTDQELKAEQAERDAEYQKQYHSWSARWNRFLDRILGPA